MQFAVLVVRSALLVMQLAFLMMYSSLLVMQVMFPLDGLELAA